MRSLKCPSIVVPATLILIFLILKYALDFPSVEQLLLIPLPVLFRFKSASRTSETLSLVTHNSQSVFRNCEVDKLQDHEIVVRNLTATAKHQANALVITNAKRNPGVVVRTTPQGCNEFVHVVVQQIKNFVKTSVQLEEISKIIGSDDTRFTVDDIHIIDYSMPTIECQFTPSDKFTLSVSHGSFEIGGKFHMESKHGVPWSWSAFGVKLNSLQLNATAELIRNSRGILQANISTQCVNMIDSLSINLPCNKASDVFACWDIVKMLKSEEGLQIFADMACKSLRQLTDIANNKLNSSPPYYQVFDILKLDLSLIENARVQFNAMDFLLRGETKRSDGKCDTPFPPPPIQFKKNIEKYIGVVHISDFVLESFMYQATQMKLFTNLHAEKISEIQDLLRLSCVKACLGKIATNMSASFFATSGELILNFFERPLIEFTPSGTKIIVDVSLELKYLSRYAYEEKQVVLTFDLQAAITIQKLFFHYIDKTHIKLTGNAIVQSVKAINIYPRIDQMMEFANVLQKVINSGASNLLNRKLRQGYLIEMKNTLELRVVDAEFLNRTLVLGIKIFQAFNE